MGWAIHTPYLTTPHPTQLEAPAAEKKRKVSKVSQKTQMKFAFSDSEETATPSKSPETEEPKSGDEIEAVAAAEPSTPEVAVALGENATATAMMDAEKEAKSNLDMLSRLMSALKTGCGPNYFQNLGFTLTNPCGPKAAEKRWKNIKIKKP